MLKLDLIIASVIALGGVVLTRVEYLRASETIVTREIALEGLEDGEKRYAISSGASCVGSLETRVTVEPRSLTLGISGSIRVANGAETVNPKVEGTARFNGLGQLQDLLVQVVGPGISASLDAHNTNPIALTLSSEIRGHHLQHSFSLPGPIVVKRAATSRYVMTYPASASTAAQMSRAAAEPILKDLKLSLHESWSSATAGHEKECDGEESASLDISRVSTLLPSTLAGGAH